MDICSEDAVWSVTQQREANLRSFQVQPKRHRSPSIQFEPWQIAVAIQVLGREDTA